MKIYLEIYYLGCNNAAELQYSFFISISVINVMQLSTSFALKLRIPSSGYDNSDSAKRSQCSQSLFTQDITDKTAYLSKVTK